MSRKDVSDTLQKRLENIEYAPLEDNEDKNIMQLAKGNFTNKHIKNTTNLVSSTLYYRLQRDKKWRFNHRINITRRWTDNPNLKWTNNVFLTLTLLFFRIASLGMTTSQAELLQRHQGITTASERLDRLFGPTNGIPRRSIVEFSGASGSGKTQLW